MGMKLFSDDNTTSPNPDPKNFKILAVSIAKRKRSICVVEVNYPGCTTFEGNKILVYEAELKVFSNPSFLDPHFTECLFVHDLCGLLHGNLPKRIYQKYTPNMLTSQGERVY